MHIKPHLPSISRAAAHPEFSMDILGASLAYKKILTLARGM
jgi:hypothetical protein